MSTIPQGTAEIAARAPIASAFAGGRLLSNGHYRVLLTHSGAGASTCGAHALTRWSPDPLEDCSGIALWVRDRLSGRSFTLGYAPAGRAAEHYETTWEPGVFSLSHDEDGLEARLDVCVAAHEDAEVRRLVLTNRSGISRSLDVTTAADIVLNLPAADAGHPAFSKLFIQTEWVQASRAILARRRPRGNDETHPVLVHALLEPGETSCETDRVRFIGRGGSGSHPASMAPGAVLSGTVGNVLDPVIALRRSLELAPGASATLTFVLGAAPDRERALALLARLPAGVAADGVFALARARAREQLQRAGVTPQDAAAVQALAVAMLYGHGALRGAPEAMLRDCADAASPGALGLSPERLGVVVLPGEASSTGAIASLVATRRYWRELGVETDVIVLGGSPAGESGDLQFLPAGSISTGARATLASAARLVLSAPVLETAREALGREGVVRPAGNGRTRFAADMGGADLRTNEPLREFNGHGGFTADGTEYVVRMPYEAGTGLRLPPLPWVNVIANPDFGFIVSETGAGATWSGNSREHRLTPWSNDPVLDPHGEAHYLRDEDSGEWWSPLAGPAPRPAAYEMRHGFGYSVSRHVSAGLEQEVTFFALTDAPVKVSRVRVTNRSSRARRVSFWAYQRLVLGVLPEESARFVVTAHDDESAALLARNPMAAEFAGRVAFATAISTAVPLARSTTTDRGGFLGAGGSPGRPQALLTGAPLDGRAGAGLDPCFAEQVTLQIAPGETVECAFVLGECEEVGEVRALLTRLRVPGALDAALESAKRSWRELVSGVHIETPEPALDLMVNGWLAYQTLACRIWGRTAFYQSGGAFGFRDQLQDAASLLHLRPELTREQILRNAAHQFVEGDVLHWWHPPLSKGIRTRFADDLLWMPLLTAYYIGATGDWSVLDERARFLEARALEPGEDEVFLVPRDSGQSADIYDHCCLAIDRSLVRGAHGLPLFGTGDWNDGMNRVGREGRGESVWMGFFLHAILGDFVPLCERRGDHERAERYARFREQLRVALNDAGWDGEWYRRAYYDNGEPMGSRQSDECRIDGLAQAWAVLSGAAPPERARMAMDAVGRELVSERDGLIRLLTPAFKDTPNDPGYIKGYVAGVRENGGQYTHAALWVVRAYAELGRHDLAAKLLAMLSPVSHTSDSARLAVYRTEPYVIAADVYGEAPHVGRGGWTWYTGSAGWMLRVAIESVLGIKLVHGETLRIRPCTPAHWREYRVSYRVPGGGATYCLTVRCPDGNPQAVVSATVDGVAARLESGTAVIPILRDSGSHDVELVLGPGEAT